MTDEQEITTRILNVLPSRGFELSTFFSLFRIKMSDKVETACVTCGVAPELLLNKDFIAEHCKTDEHLFMLVMHELYHVILGHTRLFPKANEPRNIAFDAVINALLCSLFPAPEFTSFFTDYYPADEMPYALLRPRGEGTPEKAKEALRLLYDENGTGTYHDVFLTLGKMPEEDMDEKSRQQDGGGKGNGGKKSKGSGGGGRRGDGGEGEAKQPKSGEDSFGEKKPELLGSHDNKGEKDMEKGDETDATLAEFINEVIAKWQSPDKPISGRDMGSGVRKRDYTAKTNVPPEMKKGLRRLMGIAMLRGIREERCRRVRPIPSFAETFVPILSDRTHEAKKLLLGNAIIYETQLDTRRLAFRDNVRTCVYFDVSGSIEAAVPSVAEALLPYCRRKMCDLHVFSTVVAKTTIRELKEKHFTSSGGTDINCVLRHALSLRGEKKPKSIVVITDGFTGAPSPSLAAQMAKAGIKMYVGLVDSGEHNDTNRKYLESSAAKIINLYQDIC